MDKREQVFRHWLREHRGIVAKVARAYAYTLQDREDLTQEILLQMWRSTAAFRGEAQPSTWIYRVALNTAMAWKRSSARPDGRPENPEEFEPPRVLPADAAEQEQLEWLYREIAGLPKVDRSLLLLYLDGVPYREMAEILGISETHAGVKLSRLKKRLAARAEGAGHGP